MSSILSLAQSDNICIPRALAEYYARQDVYADKLYADSIQLGNKIQSRDSIIMLLKMDKADLKQELGNKDRIIDGYRSTVVKLNTENSGLKSTVHKQRKIIFWETITNLAKDIGIGLSLFKII